MQEKQPSALLQPLPSSRAGLQRAEGSEEQSVAGEEVHSQEGVWCMGSSPQTKKRLRSSLAHRDSWLSHIASVHGMEQFTQHRGGGAGVSREAALHVEASSMNRQKEPAASPPKPEWWSCATRIGWVTEPIQGMPGWRGAGWRHSDATARAIP